MSGKCKSTSKLQDKKNALLDKLFGSSSSKSSNSSNADITPVVVIIGGGYGGIRAAQDLDSSGLFRVALLDRKDYFLNNIAGVPAAVQEGYAEGMCVPYDKLFRTKTSAFLQAEVQHVQPDCVVLQDETELQFDYCIIATGSSYAFPFKVPDVTKEAARNRFQKLPSLIADANSVVVAGGGAVGCEMAGEIASCHPDKKVTLVHSREKLLPGDIKDDLREKTVSYLKDTLKVNVILGERLTEGLDDKQSPEDTTKSEATSNQTFLTGSRYLKTDKGTELQADMVFLCWGASVNSASLQSNFQSSLVESGPDRGRIQVDPQTLLVAPTTNIFAIGDVAALESKMACYAGEQGAFVAQRLIAMARSSGEDLSYWGHSHPAMMVPLGGTQGYMQLPNPGGTILGPPFAAWGKNHLIRSWAKTVRPTSGLFSCPFSQAAESSDKAQLAQAFGVTQDEAIAAIERGAFRVQEESGRTNT